MLNMNRMKDKIHKNAVNHGWWESERNVGELFALIHSELSEALEEDRAGRPMVWHECLDEGQEERPTICERCTACMKYAEKEKCKNHSPKSEGVAVELIDYCIRLLDLAGKYNMDVDPRYMDDERAHYACDERAIRRMRLPELIATLHLITSDGYQAADTYGVRNAEDAVNEAIATVFCWLDAQGVDADKVMLEKHKYNVTRPYKHGKRY